ncbi:hypothetical protein [Ohtaekwangia koreensis]|uniref:Uncharacterized protein n=1 Tax=Ohtaekwangia koreensis TaxID=688867 RepID=A0A1T5J252_9BACT|nr:hypothetical protein [Ohtaekwangia koreensis]SKC45444.1 hypothetical protein SAMN05660236_0670 [Ohtaekwangia koreensis]
MWNDDDEEMDDADYDPEKERRRVEALPIFQKAEEICELTRRIIDSIDDEEIRMIHSNVMLEDSIVIPEKIASAEAMNDFIMKMENATVVKIHARSLQTQTASLIFEEVLPEEYLRLLRKEIEAFRLLFREWIKTFHKSPKEGDGWGLFVEDDE